MKSKSENQKPKIVTISWRTCPKNCPGCYLHALDKYPIPYESPEENINNMLDINNVMEYNIDRLFFNINCVQDWATTEEFLNVHKTYKKVDTSVIVPISVAQELEQVTSGVLVEEKEITKILSINLFDKEHMKLVKNSKKKHNLNINPTTIEASFNYKTAKKKYAKLISKYGKETNINSIKMNYIINTTSKKENIHDVLLSMLEVWSQNDLPLTGQLSSCLTTYHNPTSRPCVEYDLLEYVDNKLRKRGCPYSNIYGEEQCYLSS